MKKLLYSFLLISFALVSCNKNENRNKDESSENHLIIEGTVENGAELDIDSVGVSVFYKVSEEEQKEFILDRVPYVNGSFKLIIPSTLDEKYLSSNVIDYFGNSRFDVDKEESPITISDKSVKILPGINIQAYKNGESIGDISLSPFDCKTQCRSTYFYAEKPFSVKGKYEEDIYFLYEYDADFNEGWNLKYNIFQYKDMPLTVKVLNTIPNNLKWYFCTTEDVANPDIK